MCLPTTKRIALAALQLSPKLNRHISRAVGSLRVYPHFCDTRKSGSSFWVQSLGSGPSFRITDSWVHSSDKTDGGEALSFFMVAFRALGMVSHCLDASDWPMTLAEFSARLSEPTSGPGIRGASHLLVLQARKLEARIVLLAPQASILLNLAVCEMVVKSK